LTLNQIYILVTIAFENIFDDIANLYIIIAKFKSASRIQNLLKFASRAANLPRSKRQILLP
jgi:hypothetical protein